MTEYRTPTSWVECADWLDAGGVVEVWERGSWQRAISTASDFRQTSDSPTAPHDRYRLVPPPNLYLSPWTDGAWIALAKDVPEGWEARQLNGRVWVDLKHFFPESYVECRPVPAPSEPATEKVGLHELRGRTVKGATKAVGVLVQLAQGKWRWGLLDGATFPLPVDESGRVEVYVEQKGEGE